MYSTLQVILDHNEMSSYRTSKNNVTSQLSNCNRTSQPQQDTTEEDTKAHFSMRHTMTNPNSTAIKIGQGGSYSAHATPRRRKPSIILSSDPSADTKDDLCMRNGIPQTTNAGSSNSGSHYFKDFCPLLAATAHC